MSKAAGLRELPAHTSLQLVARLFPATALLPCLQPATWQWPCCLVLAWHCGCLQPSTRQWPCCLVSDEAPCTVDAGTLQHLVWCGSADAMRSG
eukprot:11198116-Alexandrium_andersonii.AAC.1